MRTEQLQSLNDDELSLLLYIFNVLEPKCIKNVDVIYKELLWYNHDTIIWKLSQYESKLNEEGKKIFKELMRKINSTPLQDKEEFEKSQKILTYNGQLEFQF